MSVAKKLLSGSALALIISAGTSLFVIGGAQAQTNYYWGTASFGEPVEVDLQALESLGPEPNLPQLLHPTQPLPAQPGVSRQAPQPRRILPASPDSMPKSSLIAPGEAGRPAAGQTAAEPPKSSLVTPPSQTVKPVPAKPAAAPKTAAPAKPSKPESAIIDQKPAAAMAKPAPVPAKPDIPEAPAAKAETPKPMKVEEPAKAEAPTMPAKAEEKAAVAAKPLPKPAKVEPAPAAPAKADEPKAAEKAPEPVKVEPAQPAASKVEKAETKPEKAEAEKPVAAKAPAPKPAEVTETKAEPAKPAPAAAATVEEETQVAAIDPNLVTESGNQLSIKFPEGVSDLPAGVKPALDKLASRMEDDEDLRVQLLGYAAASGESPSQARRMSLFRALSVRTYLMKKGVRSTRMDVRALGSKVEAGTPDRVDIVIPE